MQPSDEPLISISEAARQVGVNKSTLSRQIAAGAIRSHEGKVRLSEVLEDRASNIDLSGARRARNEAGSVAPAPATDDATVLVDGVALPFAKAQALKETYLARLRQQEFETKAGNLVPRADAEKVLFDAARDYRDGWLSWPARVATTMAAELSVDAAALTTVLNRYVQQHLAEQGEPDAEFKFAA